MTYIEYLNGFNQWLETNTLPSSSQLLYFKLLNVFNRMRWPEYVQLDNLRLMIMLDGASKTTVIKARDNLIEAGFILYQPGRKGVQGRYALSLRYKKCTPSDTETVLESKNDTENDTLNDTKIEVRSKKCTAYDTKTSLESKNCTTNDTENDTHIKNNILSSSSSSPSLRDEGLGKVITAYMDKINPTASQTSLEELAGYVKRLGAEVCLRAIDETLDAGADKINWHYLRGILRRLSERGVRSLADWDAMEAKRDQARRDRQGAPSRDTAARAALKGPAPMPCAPGEADLRARKDMDNLRVMMARMKQKEQDKGDGPQNRQGEDPGIIYLEYCQG